MSSVRRRGVASKTICSPVGVVLRLLILHHLHSIVLAGGNLWYLLRRMPLDDGGFHHGGAIDASLLQGRPDADPSGSGDHCPGCRPAVKPRHSRTKAASSFWLLGSYASQAAVPSDAGLVDRHDLLLRLGASADRGATFARGGRIEAGIDTRSNICW